MKMDWPGVSDALSDNDKDAVALRGARRDSLFLKASVSCPLLPEPVDVVVRNISAGGMLADTPDDFPIGTQLTVTLRNIGAVSGRIVWAQAGRFGISFDHPVDPQAVRKPVARNRAQTRAVSGASYPASPAPRRDVGRGRRPIG